MVRWKWSKSYIQTPDLDNFHPDLDWIQNLPRRDLDGIQIENPNRIQIGDPNRFYRLVMEPPLGVPRMGGGDMNTKRPVDIDKEHFLHSHFIIKK